MTAKTVGAFQGKLGFLGTIGVRFIMDGEEADGRFSVVEHPMSPRALAAPLHRHTREDEYSYVIRGRLGALLGNDVVFANPGDFVFKLRNQWHSFWNASDEATSIIEIISPGGFEHFFHELSDMGGVTAVLAGTFQELCSRYGLEMNLESVPDLVQRFDLRFPGERVPPGPAI